jgi:hypothetical protein
MSKFFVLLYFIVLSSGCAVYQGIQAPQVKSVAIKFPIVQDFEFQYSYCHGGVENAQFSGQHAASMRTRIDAAVKASNLVGPTAPEGTKLRIELINDEDSNLGLAALSGATLGIIPCFAENHLKIKAMYIEVGKIKQSVKANSSVKGVIQLFLVFYLPFNDWNIVDRNVTYLSTKVCNDLILELSKHPQDTP